MNKFISENGGILALLAVVTIALGVWIEWRIGGHLDSRGLIEPAKITAMADDIQENEEDIGELEDRWNAIVDAVAAAGRTD